MNFKTVKYLWILAFCMMIAGVLSAQQDATAIIEKAEDKLRGEKAHAELRMTIIRPKWQRALTMKSWTLGDDYSLVLITAPARDNGTAFLKRKKELWNWQPSIERTIKMPPSMMMQSWMGSDFTNDDLVRESSFKNDFTSRHVGTEIIDDRRCYKIEMLPKPDAAVVWGKLLIWIDEKDYLELKVEFYDEDDYLVNTLHTKDIKQLGGRLLPSKMELIPAEKPGHKTVMEYLYLNFDLALDERFFSLQNLKRVK